jgi:alkylmercury lyase-like protein
MTANDSVQSAAPDQLAVRLARLGLPAAGAQDRQAALPGPLQAFHRALLGAFLTDAGPPDLTVVGQLAAELELEPQAALAALAAADLVHTDPATRRVRVAYPFSGPPTPHRVELADRPTVYAMCALDALGIPRMTRRPARIRSTDPTSGQPITVQVDDQGWRWRPATTVVLAGTATMGDACGSVADCCCPYINFHANPHDADTYRQAHPAMTAELLEQAEAVAAARWVFGGLLRPDSGDDSAGLPAPR